MFGYPCILNIFDATSNATNARRSRAHTGAYISAPAPNPGNGMVTILYNLPDGIAAAALTVYNVEGKAVNNYPLNAYDKQLTMDNSKLAPGTYYCTLSAENMQAVSTKMIVVK
jgi:hypothetical protein